MDSIIKGAADLGAEGAILDVVPRGYETFILIPHVAKIEALHHERLVIVHSPMRGAT